MRVTLKYSRQKQKKTHLPQWAVTHSFHCALMLWENQFKSDHCWGGGGASVYFAHGFYLHCRILCCAYYIIAIMHDSLFQGLKNNTDNILTRVTSRTTGPFLFMPSVQQTASCQPICIRLQPWCLISVSVATPCWSITTAQKRQRAPDSQPPCRGRKQGRGNGFVMYLQTYNQVEKTRVY